MRIYRVVLRGPDHIPAVDPQNIHLVHSGPFEAARQFADRHLPVDWQVIPGGRLDGTFTQCGRLVRTHRFEAIDCDQRYGALIFVNEDIGESV